MNKRTITYRFDNPQQVKVHNEGDEKNKKIVPLHEEEYKVTYDHQPLNEFTTDFGAWNSSFDPETEQLEQLIRDSNDTMKEPNYEGATGYYGTSQYFNKDEISSSRYIRRSEIQWGKIITTVSGAIVTGVVFGFFILSLFTNGNDAVIDSSQTTEEQNNSSSIVMEPLSENDVTTNSNNAMHSGTIEFIMPEQSYYILQHGVFSTIEGAKTAISGLNSNGFAAAREVAESEYVYAGIFTNRDDALLMSHILNQAELETYIKIYSIPEANRIYWQIEQSDQAGSYFLQGNQLVDMISNLTVIQLKQTEASAIAKVSMDGLREAHQSWNSLSSQIIEGVPVDARQQIQKANNAMNTAMVSLEAYKKNPSFSYLWQTQTSLMEYVIAQREIMNLLKAG